MTNETARILQAQAAWAVARIVHHSLFRITLNFKCRLYTQKSRQNLVKNFGVECFLSLCKRALKKIKGEKQYLSAALATSVVTF